MPPGWFQNSAPTYVHMQDSTHNDTDLFWENEVLLVYLRYLGKCLFLSHWQCWCLFDTTAPIIGRGFRRDNLTVSTNACFNTSAYFGIYASNSDFLPQNALTVLTTHRIELFKCQTRLDLDAPALKFTEVTNTKPNADWWIQSVPSRLPTLSSYKWELYTGRFGSSASCVLFLQQCAINISLQFSCSVSISCLNHSYQFPCCLYINEVK